MTTTTGEGEGDSGPVHKRANHVLKAISEYDSDLFLIRKPDFTLCERKALSNQAFETQKQSITECDPPRKSDSEDLWMQSSFGKWFVHAHFGSACWSHAWVNQRGLRSRNKILPRSAQILIVIGNVFAMHVNTRSSNHEPYHEADRDPKRLSERDSFLCEHSQCLTCWQMKRSLGVHMRPEVCHCLLTDKPFRLALSCGTNFSLKKNE